MPEQRQYDECVQQPERHRRNQALAKRGAAQQRFKQQRIDKGHQESDRDFETSFDFNSDTFVDGVGGKFIFNPLLFLYTKNHDFDQTEEKKNPIEFISAYNKNKKVTITPDIYTIFTIHLKFL